MQPDKDDPHRPGRVRPEKRKALQGLPDDLVRKLETALADITRQFELIQTDAQQLRSTCDELVEKDHLKDELISIASHELKSPLTSIKGYSDLIRISARSSDACATCLRNISVVEAQVRKMTNLVNKLLDTSRIQVGRFALNPRQTDLLELARVVVEQSRVMSTRHVIELETDLTQLVGECDPERIEEVLNNLLDNAVKYSPNGGPVRVIVRAESDEALISVSDQGIGVPAGDIPHLFGAYARASNALQAGIVGLGIGLFVSNQIISQHGGRMWVDSVEGKGSTFHFKIPLGEASVE